jgi:hypothetical protein
VWNEKTQFWDNDSPAQTALLNIRDDKVKINRAKYDPIKEDFQKYLNYLGDELEPLEPKQGQKMVDRGFLILPNKSNKIETFDIDE